MTKYFNTSKKIQINGKTLHSRIARLNIIKMSILPKLVYRPNAIPIKILARPFYRHKETFSIIYIEGNRPRNS